MDERAHEALIAFEDVREGFIAFQDAHFSLSP